MRSSRPQKRKPGSILWHKQSFWSICHDGLLHKLENIGITWKLPLWFGSYLANRRQRVTIGNETSHIGTISSGVPQGSVLGPLLFIIFINDIVENIRCNIRLFADDTTLFIDFRDEATGTNMINSDLLAIQGWVDKWLVSFCPKKNNRIYACNTKTQQGHTTCHIFRRLHDTWSGQP